MRPPSRAANRVSVLDSRVTFGLTQFMILRRSIIFRVMQGLMAVGAVLSMSACGTQTSQSFITVSFTPGFMPTAMKYGEQCGVAATITNDYKNQGVTWSAACSPAPCGTFNPGISDSTDPVTYESPASGGATSVIITATSVTDPTKKATSGSIPLGASSSGCVTSAASERAENRAEAENQEPGVK